MNELHFDSGEILKHRKTPEGYLQCFIVAARTGDLEYEDGKGNRRIEFIEEEDLFDPRSYNTLKGKPIPVEHPGRMDSTNTVGLMKGAVMNTIVQAPKVYDHSFLGVFATIYDQPTIEKIESGELRQVSCSYDCDVILQPDGRYRQVDRRYNHLALTTNGRAGSSVAIHMDSNQSPLYWKQRNDSMEKVKVKGKTFEVQTELYDALRDFMDDLKGETPPTQKSDSASIKDEERQDSTQTSQDMAALETENAVLLAKIEELQKALDEARKMIDEMTTQSARMDSAAELLNTWEKARPVLLPGLQSGTIAVEGISCNDGDLEFSEPLQSDSIKKAVIEAKGVKLRNNDSAHIALAFDMIDIVKDPALTVDRLVRQDSSRSGNPDSAREKRMAEQLEISRKPLDLDRRNK